MLFSHPYVQSYILCFQGSYSIPATLIQRACSHRAKLFYNTVLLIDQLIFIPLSEIKGSDDFTLTKKRNKQLGVLIVT